MPCRSFRWKNKNSHNIILGVFVFLTSGPLHPRIPIKKPSKKFTDENQETRLNAEKKNRTEFKNDDHWFIVMSHSLEEESAGRGL